MSISNTKFDRMKFTVSIWEKKGGGSVNVFNATFNNISVISCRSVLLMDNTSYQYKVQFDFLGTSQLRMVLFIFYSFS